MEAQADQKQAPVPISLRLGEAFREGLNVYNLGPVTSEQIAAADKAAADNYADVHPGPQRVGLVRSVGAVPLSVKEGSALRITLPDGGNLWTLAIRSPGAFGLRLHFTNFDVGAGSAIVYARSADGVIVRGPYTGRGPGGRGEFWTASLPGDTAFIEVSGTDGPQLEVAELLHFDRDLTGSVQDQAATAQVLPCHLDVMCADFVNPMARDAVGRMNFVKDGLGFLCTGTLLEDLDGETVVPHMLTARHCISTQAVTNTLEVVWLWQQSSCNGTLPNFASLPRNVSGTLLETNNGNDMSFIRLDGTVPGGVSLAGWTRAPLPDRPYGVHHPAGSFKRATLFDEHFLLISGCIFFDPGDYHFVRAINGVVQGGSSGSGIFNSAGQIMGQLYGICCGLGHGLDCNESDCSNRDQWRAVYGEFDTTFPIIERWLKLGGTIHVDGRFRGSELGTPDQPFNTVNEANTFAWDGARIKIQAGPYREPVTFSKRLIVLASGGSVTIGQ
ncbi:MAG: hypothetical protein NZ823_06365 [Blastocatellia bacterium]|nr:hypothetical protein [Blastocatellia bacterium]